MKNENLKVYAKKLLTAFLTYLVSYLACSASFRSPLLSLLADSVDEDKVKLVLAILCAICYFLLPFLFYIFFQEAEARKRSVTALYRKKPDFLPLYRSVLLDRDFHLNGGVLTLLLLTFAPKNILNLLLLPFCKGFFLLRWVNIALFYAVPMFFLLGVAECLIRLDWHRQWRLSGFGFLEDGSADVPLTTKKRLALNVFIVFLAVYFLPSLTVYYQVARIGIKLVWQSGTLQGVIVALFFLPSLKNVGEKKKLLKEIRYRALAQGFTFHQEKNLFAGFFGLSKKADFTVEGQGFSYSGRILPVRSKNAELVFFASGTYRFEKRFLIWSIPFFSHKIPQGEEKENVQNFLIPLKEVKTIMYRDEDVEREIRVDDRVNSFRVELINTFSALLYKNGKRR